MLQPFEEATKEASFESASIAIVISLVKELIHQMEDRDKDHDEGVLSMKHHLLQSLLSCFIDIESLNQYVLATLLDPHFKHRCFSSASRATSANEVMTEECQNDCDKPETVTSPKRLRKMRYLIL